MDILALMFERLRLLVDPPLVCSSTQPKLLEDDPYDSGCLIVCERLSVLGVSSLVW